MGRISKYTPEERLQAVLDYKSGKRKVPEICRDLGLHSSGKAVYYWVAMYETLGEDIFETKRKNNVYSKEMKHTVVDDYLAGKGSYKQIALAYGISSPSIVEKWIHKYGEERVGESIRKINKNTREELEKLRKENLKLKKEIQMREKKVILINKVKTIEDSAMVTGGKWKPKYLAVKELHERDNWSINWMCQELKITRAGYYKWLHRLKGKERVC